jgi:DNA-binding NarL/FixJ family response regulator
MIIDHHPLFREGISNLLSREDDFQVVAGADHGDDAVAIAQHTQPDVVLVDVQVPDRTLDTVGRVRGVSPATRVLIMTMVEQPQLLWQLIELGVRGYLLKSVWPEELKSAIRGICNDNQRFILSASREAFASLRVRMQTLSGRELEVLKLVSRGFTNRQVASKLMIAEGTVKRHLHNIYAKLGATSRIDAVNKAAEQSLIHHSIGDGN